MLPRARNAAVRARTLKRFRGGLVFKAHRHFVSLNSRLESNKTKREEEEAPCPPTSPVSWPKYCSGRVSIYLARPGSTT